MRTIREVTQQDCWKTQDGIITKKCGARLSIYRSYATFFRHSVVLSRKLPIEKKILHRKKSRVGHAQRAQRAEIVY